MGGENMRSKTDRIICGTCQYWTGAREPVFDAKGTPKVDILDEFGLCEHFMLDENISRRRDLKCKCFSKWTEIL